MTCLALLFGFTHNWPDNVYVDYGLPLTWGINTVSTFVGPVDQWSVNTIYLLWNLIFWLGLMVAAVAVLIYELKPKKRRIR